MKLEITNYYGKFLPNLATALTIVVKEKKWTKKCEKPSFD